MNTPAVTLDLLKSLHIPAQEQGKNVFRVDGPFGAVMYYAKQGNWQHHGRTFKGTTQEFREWLKRQGML